MPQKSAAFMSPKAAIAKGRENSKGWKKNPAKLLYNFDAHKKTASEGMFSTSSSEIPDELWRAPTPMQRQADAVVLWAELTGKHAGLPQPKLSQSALATAKPISMAPPGVQRQLAAARKFFPRAAYSQDRTTGAIYKLSSALQKSASGCGSHKPTKPKKKTVKKASAKEAGLEGMIYRGDAAEAIKGRDALVKMREQHKARASKGGIRGFLARRAEKAVGKDIARHDAYLSSLKKKAEMIKEGRNQAFVDTLHAIRRNPEISGAALGAPVGAATNYMAYRPTKSGVSRAEASVMGELERARRLNASKKTIDRLKKKLALEEKRRKSLGKTTAVGGALGAGIGASLAHGSAKARGIR